MRTGIILPTAVPGTTGEQILDWARLAEERGFDTLGVIDGAVHGVADDGYDPIIAASMAGAVTKSIELITHKLISPLGSGTVLATQASSLERASGGRFTLALGLRQSHVSTVRVDASQRARLLDVHLAQLMGTRVLIASDAADAVRRLGTRGLGWTMTGGTAARFAAGVTAVHDAWAYAGRPGRPRTVAVFSAALAAGTNAFPPKSVSFDDWIDPEASDLTAGSVATTPDAVRAYLEAFERAGADDVLIAPCSADLAQLDLIADVALTAPALV
jgi:alkanesulfonate monooxygenase SsuD/methylene tetrahydromethanopterin reductase-like flavin-dependent oxidoreductase (luciferase family)